MKSGDTVQIQQRDGALQHWLYAKVISPTAEGAIVEVAHPGNREDGRQKFVTTAEIRTKAQIEAQIKPAKPEDSKADRDQRQHLRDQADRLS